jgi:hypothetical protein
MKVGVIDPQAGFMSVEVYWRPKHDDRNPNRPGGKVSISMFRSSAPEASCYCGSGRAFQGCCRNRKKWPVVSPDPGGMSFSQLQAHSSVYPIREAAKLRQAFMADSRLQCIVDGPGEDGFWLFVDDPPIETTYGRLNFGDLEIKAGRLLVTATSAKRHEILQKLLAELAASFLGTAFVKNDPPLFLDKPAHPQLMEIKSPPGAAATPKKRKRKG